MIQIQEGLQINSQFIAPLHGLRGIAAVSVVLAHSQRMTHIPLPDMAGAMGVLLFFTLSGFLMAHLYMHRQPTIGTIAEYLRARVARIYPLFASVCVVSALLFYTIAPDFPYQMDIHQLWLHLLGAGAGLTIWTISSEFQFYALFILLWLMYSWLGSHRRIKFILLVVVLIGILWAMGFPGGRIAITGYLQVFLIGMLAQLVLPLFSLEKARRTAAIALALLLLVYVVAYFITPLTIGGRWVYHDMPLVIAMGGLILAATLAADTSVGRFLSTRPMFWLGEVSFGIYLLHRPMMYLMETLLPADVHWAIATMLLFALVGTAAHLCYIFIEKPGRAYIKSIPLKGVLAK